MDIEAAVKQVRSEKPKENFILVNLDWNTALLLPYKAGIDFINSLSQAFQMENPNHRPRIVSLNKDQITFRVLSAQEVEDMRVAALLGITLDELKTARQTVTQE